MSSRRTISVLILAALLAITAAEGADEAADWPQLHGPRRDGVYRGPALVDSLPSAGPAVTWRKKIGLGFAGPSVADGKLVLFHRMAEKEILDCLDAATGKPLWTASYPASYRDRFGFDEGPRAVPTIDNGRVYTNGAAGILNCADLFDHCHHIGAGCRESTKLEMD